jgi:hypothetical protein
MKPSARRVLELAAQRGGCPVSYFDTFRGLRLSAKDLLWDGHVMLDRKGKRPALRLTQSGQEWLEKD